VYLFLFQEEVMTGASIPDWCFCGHFLDTIKHQHYYYSGISWSGNFEIAQVIMIFWQKSGNVMMKVHWSYNYSLLVTNGYDSFFHFVLLLPLLIYTHMLYLISS